MAVARGLGKSLAALLAAVPRGGSPPPQTTRTPSAADIESRIEALTEEVRALGRLVEQLVRERRDAGKATTTSLLAPALRCQRAVCRAARDQIPGFRRITKLLNR